MENLDSICQDAVDQEIDRLARLSPCELMQLTPENRRVDTKLGPAELTYLIFDGGDFRHIAVMIERSNMFGLTKRKFTSALKVKLSFERLSTYEVADLYD